MFVEFLTKGCIHGRKKRSGVTEGILSRRVKILWRGTELGRREGLGIWDGDRPRGGK